jgi:hypothetical protein
MLASSPLLTGDVDGMMSGGRPAMRTDTIEAVGINDQGSLWVKPATATFPFIYREAKEVHWDAQRLYLYSPKPREWTYIDWFEQIRDAAAEQGVKLTIETTTSWSNIEPALREGITAASSGG